MDLSESVSPNPDFSRPLAALKECHERIRSQCSMLGQLVVHLKEHGCDGQARQAAANAIRFFDHAAHQHHEDEEQDLLPRMMGAASKGRGSSLTRLVADLVNEHRAMYRAWIELRAVLQMVAAGESTALDAKTVERFARPYLAHLTLEEVNLFPLAELLLSRDDLAAIGASMTARRGARIS
ncbi:MAG: hemerythrin domain-containing protein [Betaproteobacteria bacterium]|nr:hemerythrin domain-containing protein [Betaproteobacteria bacterium]